MEVRYCRSSELFHNRNPAEKRPDSSLSINATVSFYSPAETDEAINSGTAQTLASANVTFVIAPKAITYQVKFQAVNSFTKDVLPDALIAVKDQNGNLLAAGEDGSYTLNDANVYTATASLNGYVGEGGADIASYTFTPSKDDTISLLLTRAEDGKCLVKFAYTDENNNPLSLSNVTVTVWDPDDQTTEIVPEADGSYLLWKDHTYRYSINAYGYYKITSQELKVSSDQIFTVSLKERIKTYTMTLIAYSYTTQEELPDAAQKVVGEKDGVETEVTANSDGTYTLDWETAYTIYLSHENYKDREYTLPAFTETTAQAFEERLALNYSSKHQLELTIASTEEFLNTISEGQEPMNWPAGTKDSIQAAINAAKEVLNNEASSDNDYDSADNQLTKTIREIRKNQNP